MVRRMRAAKGSGLGCWTLEAKLGAGGNGEVWRARNGEVLAAVKILSKIGDVAYRRFVDEIEVMTKQASPGIVPIVDSFIPADPGSSFPWYAMPIGEPLALHLRGHSLQSKVRAIGQIADMLARLHERDIVHRDVKPSNMLLLQGTAHLADFGLVSYPTKTAVTKTRESVGPLATMAPEARRGNRTLDPKATDVYSLAKSLWMLVRETSAGFEGQYSTGQSISIQGPAEKEFLEPLEQVLQIATEHEPSRRPSMRDFAERLQEWLRVSEDWSLRNRQEWPSTIARLFPLLAPRYASWAGNSDIASVLSLIASDHGLNHMFIPSGGGLDLTRVTEAKHEPDCLELHAGSQALIIKPKELELYHFADSPQWSYFLLTVDGLNPSGVDGSFVSEGQEELTELPTGEYLDPMVWHRGQYREGPLPRGSRPVSRFLEGRFAFFQKSSPYNAIGATYDGRHSWLSRKQFLQHVGVLRQVIGDLSDLVRINERVRQFGHLHHPNVASSPLCQDSCRMSDASASPIAII